MVDTAAGNAAAEAPEKKPGALHRLLLRHGGMQPQDVPKVLGLFVVFKQACWVAIVLSIPATSMFRPT